MSLTVPSISTLVTELANELGENTSDTEVTSRIERWLNEVFEDILSRRPDWKFARDQGTLLLSPNYNTGTVDVTNNSATVMGTGTSWVTSWTNRLFWTSGSGVNYRVASVDSTTQLTLSVPYQEATATLQVYELVQDRYPLDNQAFEAGITQIINPYSDDPLEEVDIEDLIRAHPKRRTFGQPEYYAVWGQEQPTASANQNAPMIYFDRFPRSAMALPYFFHKQFDRITGASRFPLPAKFNRKILVAGVKALSGEFDNEQKVSEGKYEGLIQLMIQENTITGDRTRVFHETDVPRRVRGLRLPSGYPDIEDV